MDGELIFGEPEHQRQAELRALIERVEFRPARGLGKFGLGVSGKHQALVLPERASAVLTDSMGSMGAGTGFEPVTFRL